MGDRYRWGILSTGKIAGAFAAALKAMPGAELLAVGSRGAASAARFGEQWAVPRRYASYEALAADPDIDVVYIATPHSLHAANTRLCLEAGKAVLCEKPLAMNAQEAAEMIALARARGLFLMEALWSRFLPAWQRARELVAEGAIGELRLVQANFGFPAPPNPAGRLLNPALGGGTLLDIGIYPINLAVMMLGLPERVSSQAHLGPTGVDEQAAYLFHYPSGALAILHSSFQVRTSNEAELVGTRGRIRLPAPFHHPETLFLIREGEAEQRIDCSLAGSGYRYEAEAVQRALRAGQIECETMPHAESLAIMALMDQLRAAWELRYPMEAERVVDGPPPPPLDWEEEKGTNARRGAMGEPEQEKIAEMDEDESARFRAMEEGLTYPPPVTEAEEEEFAAGSRSLREPPVSDVNLDVPYIHQLWDTPNNFNGEYACGATSTAMVLAYYGFLEPKPITAAKPYVHQSDYGWYVSNAFTHNGHNFNRSAGTPSGNAMGIYGTALDHVAGMGWVAIPGSKGGSKGIVPVLETFMKPVGNTVEVIWKPTEQDIKASLDEGHPVIISGRVFNWGHLIVIRGYYYDPNLDLYGWIVNDPYGYRVGRDYDGDNVVYLWREIYKPNGLNTKYMFRIRGTHKPA